MSFKLKIEKSLEKFLNLNQSKHRLKIGQINANIFSNKIKISPILVTDENKKVVYSVNHLNVKFNPLKAILNSNFKISFNFISSKNEKLQGQAIVTNLKSKFKIKQLATKMNSFHLQTLFKLSSINERTWKWAKNWTGQFNGLFTFKNNNSTLKGNVKRSFFKINKKLASSFSPRPSRKIYKSNISRVEFSWDTNGFRTLKPLKIKVPSLRTTILANTIAQKDFPNHNLWQVGLNSKKQWNIIFSHMMGCYPKKPTYKYIVLNGPQANYCKKLNDIATKKRRRR